MERSAFRHRDPKSPPPRVLTPRVLPSRVLTPRFLIPNLLTPRVLTPRVLTPRVLTPRDGGGEIIKVTIESGPEVPRLSVTSPRDRV
ncbi:hypothetical protein NHX12_019057 [Muraenolepis orangiensis]|uniref:Uncharacterized protein n=1 Tax=Muraenolepis orangiensis TaxID=630683 RepID=A0A9Q0ET57_9TELE|nr:hypothetical protein NHX12_019057 [Muraenolepis orangiensis]